MEIVEHIVGTLDAPISNWSLGKRFLVSDLTVRAMEAQFPLSFQYAQ